MNTILVLLNAIGCGALMIAALRYLEEHRAGPFLVRVTLMVLSLIALLAAVETLGSREPMRPLGVALTLVTGAVALWKVFLPSGACIIAWIAAWRPRERPNGGNGPGLKAGPSG